MSSEYMRGLRAKRGGSCITWVKASPGIARTASSASPRRSSARPDARPLDQGFTEAIPSTFGSASTVTTRAAPARSACAAV